MHKLFNPEKLEYYMTEGSRQVHGYLQSGSASVICSIFDIQDELKISGNIAGIAENLRQLREISIFCNRFPEHLRHSTTIDKNRNEEG